MKKIKLGCVAALILFSCMALVFRLSLYKHIPNKKLFLNHHATLLGWNYDGQYGMKRILLPSEHVDTILQYRQLENVNTDLFEGLEAGALRKEMMVLPNTDVDKHKWQLQLWCGGAQGAWKLNRSIPLPVRSIQHASLSPNGRYVSFTDQNMNCVDVYLYDLHSNKLVKARPSTMCNSDEIHVSCEDCGAILLTDETRTLRILGDKTSQFNNGYNNVITNRAGTYGVHWKTKGSELQVDVESLAPGAKDHQKYVCNIYNTYLTFPGQDGIMFRPVYNANKVVCSDDGQWWCILAGVRDLSGFESMWDSIFILWKKGSSEPAYAYFGNGEMNGLSPFGITVD